MRSPDRRRHMEVQRRQTLHLPLHPEKSGQGRGATLMRALFCRIASGLTAVMACVSPVEASPIGKAQDRCLTYGFQDPGNIALCAEYELQFSEPEHWSFKDIDGASTTCLRLGFRSEALAGCVQRQLRSSQASGPPAYRIQARP
ncbi:hypothetical protein PEC18_04605 [Paucibacter sp. O1-1]|nr:hypothetical protein [Paucibacter sp. O1-1]MDA3825151.1 hypothetical protein [Paucibacter sp. O1-1]